MEPNDLEHLRELAGRVAAEGQEAGDARQAQREAEAELLGRVIALVLPAIKAVGTRPTIAYRVTGHEDPNRHRTAEERYDHRCLLLSDDRWGPVEDQPRDSAGRYEGEDLALREDGVLIELAYAGNWSRWQGSSWGWKATVTEYATPAEALGDGWTDVDGYLKRIGKALETAEGSRAKVTRAARARTAKLRAIVELI